MIILDLFQKGGIIMWPIFGVALIAFFLIIYKSIQIYRFSFYYRRFNQFDEINNRLKEKQFQQAKEICIHNGPVEKIFIKGIEYIEATFQEDAIKDRLEMIYDNELHLLERGLPIILILGEILPMLGLLGTVSGMIHVFQAISVYGASNAQGMASGISEALLTTQTGLALAIPTLFCYTLLNSQIDSLAKHMRQAGASIVTISRVMSNKNVQKN
ncbi:hypothetical protein DID76_04535 [Candidatus Marinamargulisbacteria bacterium SCGC AG-414-C22]|nr:hypothetical protein DID76_04535 [Candidatus Marinamargulisbacteria bacterium SCGC AG-414-C22]